MAHDRPSGDLEGYSLLLHGLFDEHVDRLGGADADREKSFVSSSLDGASLLENFIAWVYVPGASVDYPVAMGKEEALVSACSTTRMISTSSGVRPTLPMDTRRAWRAPW